MQRLRSGLAILVLVAVAFVLWQHAGPRGLVPTIDPAERWNAEHAQVPDNAAELYGAAFKRLSGQEDSAWLENRRSVTDPVPPEAAEWVARNQETVELTRRATERSHCWFDLGRDADGHLMPPHMDALRTLAKLLRWRALMAIQQHDAATVADSLLLTDRIARHVDAGAPFLINALSAMWLHDKACSHPVVTQPLLWPQLSAADRAAYVARLAPIFDPPPSLLEALGGEQDLNVWLYVEAVAGSWPMLLISPPDRVAGELEQFFRPFRELSAVPVERQCDPDDPLVARARRIEREVTLPWNRPRVVASVLFFDELHALVLRARLIAQQRGTRTFLELFLYRDRTGNFPESLEPIAGDFKIDPFSGQPFVYRRTDDGFTLYSVGVDRQDDGGKHDPRFGEDRPGHDFVFWPIPVVEDDAPTTQP